MRVADFRVLMVFEFLQMGVDLFVFLKHALKSGVGFIAHLEILITETLHDGFDLIFSRLASSCFAPAVPVVEKPSTAR